MQAPACPAHFIFSSYRAEVGFRTGTQPVQIGIKLGICDMVVTPSSDASDVTDADETHKVAVNSSFKVELLWSISIGKDKSESVNALLTSPEAVEVPFRVPSERPVIVRTKTGIRLADRLAFMLSIIQHSIFSDYLFHSFSACLFARASSSSSHSPNIALPMSVEKHFPQ